MKNETITTKIKGVGIIETATYSIPVSSAEFTALGLDVIALAQAALVIKIRSVVKRNYAFEDYTRKLAIVNTLPTSVKKNMMQVIGNPPAAPAPRPKWASVINIATEQQVDVSDGLTITDDDELDEAI